MALPNIVEVIASYADSDNHLPPGCLASIGRQFHLSRERVRQIAKKQGFVMVQDEQNKYKPGLFCEWCHKEFKSKYKRKYCSPACYKKAYYKKYWTQIECEYCHRKHKVRKTEIRLRGKPRFCSKLCQGKWLGENYGVGSPNNRRGIELKYGSTEQIKKDFPMGCTIEDFVEKYNYASYSGAWRALRDLCIQKKMRKVTSGFYQVIE